MCPFYDIDVMRWGICFRTVFSISLPLILPEQVRIYEM